MIAKLKKIKNLGHSKKGIKFVLLLE